MRHFDDYVASLEKAKVVLDPARRREIILNDAKNLAFAQGYELVEDEGLLNEVAGLVEWPVVLMGTFEESFLKIPGEVIRATIRNNQKCFVVTKSAGALPSPLRGGVGGGGPDEDRRTTPTPALRDRSGRSPVFNGRRVRAPSLRLASSWSPTSRRPTAEVRSSPAMRA